jgi:hypothetical protein
MKSKMTAVLAANAAILKLNRGRGWNWSGNWTNQEQKNACIPASESDRADVWNPTAAYPVVTRATKKKQQTGSLALSAPSCPCVFVKCSSVRNERPET